MSGRGCSSDEIADAELLSIGPVQDGMVRLGPGVTGRLLRLAHPGWASDVPIDQPVGGTDPGVVPLRRVEFRGTLFPDIDAGLVALREVARRGQRGELTDDTAYLDNTLRRRVWEYLYGQAWLLAEEVTDGGRTRVPRPPDPVGHTFDIAADWVTVRRKARLARDGALTVAHQRGWTAGVGLRVLTSPERLVVRCTVWGGEAKVLETAARGGATFDP